MGQITKKRRPQSAGVTPRTLQKSPVDSGCLLTVLTRIIVELVCQNVHKKFKAVSQIKYLGILLCVVLELTSLQQYFSYFATPG